MWKIKFLLELWNLFFQRRQESKTVLKELSHVLTTRATDSASCGFKPVVIKKIESVAATRSSLQQPAVQVVSTTVDSTDRTAMAEHLGVLDVNTGSDSGNEGEDADTRSHRDRLFTKHHYDASQIPEDGLLPLAVLSLPLESPFKLAETNFDAYGEIEEADEKMRAGCGEAENDR